MNIMKDIGSALETISKGPARDISTKTYVNGLIVSTVDTHDYGPETAILDADTAYPVERYDSEMEAIQGHEKWVEKAKTLTEIVELGYGSSLAEETVRVKRYDKLADFKMDDVDIDVESAG